MIRSVESAQGVRGLAVATYGLCKRYGGETVLDRVDLRVPDGAVYVLVGANGAGKSTTFRMLMNLARPDAGTAEVFGMDTHRKDAHVRAQVGYVSDVRDRAYPNVTCGRLLQHVAVFYPAWDAAYATHLSRALEVRLERKVRSLSKGEAQRLHLVLALAHRPPLLLLDEPIDGLDPVIRRTTLALLIEHIADTQTTVLLSTHQLHEVQSLADHVGVLRGGRLIAQMSRDDLEGTVRRYRVEVPDGWMPPPGLRMAGLRRSSGGREIQATLLGGERDVVERLTLAGGRVREAQPLTFEDAALVLLTEEMAG